MSEQFSLAEILALLSGIGYALLVVRRNRWAWAFGAVSSGVLTVLAARNDLPLQSALQALYVLMAAYGFWHWSRASTHLEQIQRVRIARWPWGWHIGGWLSILALTWIVAPWLATHTDAAWPRLDALVTLLSLFATVMTARAVLENWVYWLIVDVLSFYLYASQGLSFVATLYAVYFLIAIWGLSTWWAQDRRERILPTGGHNRAYRVVHWFDERVRRDWGSAQTAAALGVDHETEVGAQRLAATHGLAPPILRVDTSRRRVWMPWVPGEPLAAGWFDQPTQREQMWQLLDRLRGIDASSLPALDLLQRARFLHRQLIVLDPQQASVRAGTLAALTADWTNTGCDRSTMRCLVHGDLTPTNLVVRTDGSWQLLDWEYAHRGHPLEDLAGLVVASGCSLERWRREFQPPGVVDEGDWRQLAVRVALRGLLNDLWTEVAARLPQAPLGGEVASGIADGRQAN